MCMRSTAFRLIRKGMQEPWRGTLCNVGEESYLFTRGYVIWWDEYPGPHIPAPLEIGSYGKTDIREFRIRVGRLEDSSGGENRNCPDSTMDKSPDWGRRISEHNFGECRSDSVGYVCSRKSRGNGWKSWSRPAVAGTVLDSWQTLAVQPLVGRLPVK